MDTAPGRIANPTNELKIVADHHRDIAGTARVRAMAIGPEPTGRRDNGPKFRLPIEPGPAIMPSGAFAIACTRRAKE